MPTKAGTAYVDIVGNFAPLNRQIARMGGVSAQAGRSFSRSMKVVSREAEGSRRKVASLSRQISGVGDAAQSSSRQATRAFRRIEASSAQALRALRAVEAAQRRTAAGVRPGGVGTGRVRQPAAGGQTATSIHPTVAALVPTVSQAAVEAAAAAAARHAASRVGTIGAAPGAYSTYGLARSFGRGRAASTVAEVGARASSALSIGKSFAGTFAKGIGPGLAAAGVERILTSALKGDMKAAGFQAGGALVGGVLGSFAGPAGTMIGVGLGSMAGDLLSGLFDSGKKTLTLQQKLATSAKQLAAAYRGARASSAVLTRSGEAVSRAHGRARKASRDVTAAERQLARVRKQFGPNSRQASQAEQNLANARQRSAREAKKAQRANRLHGVELVAAKNILKATILEERHRINLLHKEDKALHKQLKRAQEMNRGHEVEAHLMNKLKKNQQDLSATRKMQNQTLREASQQVGPKYMKFLRESDGLLLRTGKRARVTRKDLEGPFRAFSDLGKAGERGARRAERGYDRLKGSLRPFAREAKTQMGKASQAVKDFDSATTGALGDVKTQTNQSLVAFGVAKVDFSTRKQKGGAIVPGSGEGDSFRTTLPLGSFVLNKRATAAFGFRTGGQVPVMLEPGERTFMPHEVRRIGLGNLEAMNGVVPRFQKGGALTEPRLSGPRGSLRSIGQAAIREVYEGARSYIKKSRPQEGSIANAGPLKRFNRTYPSHSLSEVDGKARFSEALVARIARWAGLPGRLFAQIAHGESSFYPGIYGIDPGGTIGRGLWAITSGVGNDAMISRYGGPTAMFNPLVNAQVAKEIYDGAGQSISPWYGLKYVEGYARGGQVGQPFDPVLMRGGPSAAPLRRKEGGFRPKTIERIKAKAELIASQFKDYVYGGGHGEGSNVTTDYLDCSAAVAKLMQQSGWSMSVGTSGEYMSRWHPGPGDLFTIWSNVDHTFADIEGQQWGTNTSNGLGYHTHGTAGFTPRHPILNEGGKGVGGGGGDAAAPPKPEGPKTIKGKYKRRRVTTEGGGVGHEMVLARYEVTTARLNFGAMPADLPDCQKELRLRQRELGEYRAAARKVKAKDTKAALETNVKLLEGRIQSLRALRSRLLAERHRKKAGAKLVQATEFKAWNEPAKGILARRRQAYEILSQNAEQWVATEPEEPSSFAGDWVGSVLEPFINNKERPAYASLLEHERGWRNDVVSAEKFAEGRMEDWRTRIDELQKQIANIRKLKKDEPKKHALLSPKIPVFQDQMKDLRAAIKRTREQVIPAWGEELSEVQGLGRSHEILAEIPPYPVAEQFGGYIWDTQTAIRDLDLKISQARENGKDDRAGEREELYKQLLMESRQRNIVRGIEESVFGSMPPVGEGFQSGGIVGVMPPYAGKAHVGAVVPGPPGQERTMVVKSGEGIFTPEQMAALGDGGEIGPVRVNVNGDIVSSHPDPVEVLLGDRRLVAEIRKVTGRDNRRQARGAGRGLATPGVFSR